MHQWPPYKLPPILFGGKYDLIQFKVYNKNDMAASAFGLFFVAAYSRAKSAQQLEMTVLLK
jgi:hypothetical protein